MRTPILIQAKPLKSSGTLNEGRFEAQLRTVIMVKNQEQTLPLKKQQKVYIPQRHIPASTNWFSAPSPERWVDAFSKEIVEKYFEVVGTPEEADFALLGIQNPDVGVGYDATELEQGGNGYVPISLQYGTYKAEYARETSIAGGSPFEDFTNRSYKDKITRATNIPDMQLVHETKAKMGDKPVVVVVNVSKPMVFAEIEPMADVILVHMGVQDQTLMDLISGVVEPSALLPFQMPATMKTVEQQFEDVPRDMECHTDADGNVYDFAFGLNWSGVIKDERVSRYK